MNANLMKWLDTVAADGHKPHFIDMHIDKVDCAYKNRRLWVGGLVNILIEGKQYINERKWSNMPIVGCFALHSTQDALGVTFADQRGLEDELSVTPPSIYLFKTDLGLPWLDPSQQFVQIDNIFSGHVFTLFYLEYKELYEVEYRRSLWLI